MKTLTQTIFTLLILFCSCAGLTVRGAEFTREIKKTFVVNPDAKLILENKYGDIRISNSADNRVNITVVITTESRDLERATRFFEKVTIQFNNSTDLVEARTQFPEDMKIKGSFRVDYIITMPVTMSLEADNKFGDLVTGEIGGKARIRIGYGNLEISKLSNSDNLIEIKFGKSRIGWIKGAVMILKYSDFKGDYAGSLNLSSQYSNFSASKVIVLDATFEGGNLDLGSASVLTCRSKFSDVSIRLLDQKLDLTNSYGSFEINEIPAGFASLAVTNNYGNIDLGISASAGYQLDAEMHYCNLEFDHDRADLNYFNDSGHDQQVRGSVGSTPTSLVKVTSNYGNVSLNDH